MLKFVLIIGLLIVSGFALVSFPQKSPKNAGHFVTAQGQNLYLDGKQFRSMGVNRYNLVTHTSFGNLVGCASQYSDEEISSTFAQLHDMGITTVRFWLFQSFTQSGDDMARFDFVLKEAERNKIKVIPVLENHWHECTEGDVKDQHWYASGYRSPYGAYPLSLKEYIDKIVPKYKNNSTIMTWEILNEARNSDTQILYDFATDISQQLHVLDPNHLVSIGMVETKGDEEAYKKVSSVSTVDVLDYHDYNEESTAFPSMLSDSIDAARNNNKPLIVGESGIKKRVTERATFFEAKIQAFFDNGGSVYMIWSYGDPHSTNDGYNFSNTDPLVPIIKAKAAEIQ